MTPCANCGKPLVCTCARTQTAGHVISCQSPKAAIWVLVITESGKSVEGVKIETRGKGLKPTDSNGVARFDNLDETTYPVSVVSLLEPDKELYDLPVHATKDVAATNGTITQVLFILPEKATLRVELVPVGFTDLPQAEVVLSRITGTEYRDSRTITTLAEVARLPHASGKVNFEMKPARSYRVTVKIDKKDEKVYGANDVDFDLLPKENKLVKVEIHRYFEKVRFVGLCLTTVPRQVWTGPDAMVREYEAQKNARMVSVPDPATHPQEYGLHLTEYWGAKAQNEWKARYNGPRSDTADVEARVEFLRKAIETAAPTLTDDTELKVFVAPECYFLGRYGAYPHDVFGTIIQKLQDLVKDPKWKAWVFVFGTVNGFYMLDGRTQMFNICPVVKGGCGDGDPGMYTRLLQKAVFSSEIIKNDDLIRAAETDRVQITEEIVGKAFHATENEELLGNTILEILADITVSGVGSGTVTVTADAIKSRTKIRDWPDERWAAVKLETENRRTAIGLTPLARQMRGLKPDDARQRPDAPPDPAADLRYLLTHYMNKTFADKIAAPQHLGFNFHDYCFSCIRMPGPWLDSVVSGEPKDLRHTKLTFTLEICADHNSGRVSASVASVAPHELPDIHLVPSAGMVLNEARLCLVDNGFGFNCDGWNAPGFCVAVTKPGRAANIIFDLDERAPRKSGNNPLTPHTELCQRVGSRFLFIGDVITRIDITEDASAIFSYRTPAERQSYADERARNAEALLDEEQRACEQDARDADAQQQRLRLEVQKHEAAIAGKTQDIRRKQDELTRLSEQLRVWELAQQSAAPPSSTSPGTVAGPPVGRPNVPKAEKELANLIQGLETSARKKALAEEQIVRQTAIVRINTENATRLRARTRATGAVAPERLRAGQIHIYPAKDLPTAY